MDRKSLAEAAEPKNLADYLARLPSAHPPGHGGDGSVETRREDEYKGHRITILTTYRIEVDGKVLQLPLGLDNNGCLHIHSLPNYEFGSAVDLVRRLIDIFPEEFTGQPGSGGGSGGHGGHGGHHPGDEGGR
jgi:hypothetical protein